MKKYILAVFWGLLLLGACGNHEIEETSSSSIESSADASSAYVSHESVTSEDSREEVSSMIESSEEEETTAEESVEDSSVAESSEEESSVPEVSEEESSVTESSEEESSETESSHVSEDSSIPNEEITIANNIHTNMNAEAAKEFLEKIEKAAADGKSVSIYYRDTETGYYFYRNIDKRYPSASVIKAFYCQYLVATGVDLQQKIQLTEASKISSSKKLRKEHIGSWYTVEELIQYSIRNSDNMAYYLLFLTFGRSGFNDYIRSLGLEEPLLYSIEYTTIGAEPAAKCMMEIYRYAQETGNTFLIDHLKNTTHRRQIDAGTDAEIAHKYGFQDGKNLGYHDAAIVYAEEPYILTICSRENGYESGCNDVFIEVARLVEEMHGLMH